MSDTQRAYAAGRDAYQAGKRRTECPFTGKHARNWYAGWREAYSKASRIRHAIFA